MTYVLFIFILLISIPNLLSNIGIIIEGRVSIPYLMITLVPIGLAITGLVFVHRIFKKLPSQPQTTNGIVLSRKYKTLRAWFVASLLFTFSFLIPIGWCLLRTGDENCWLYLWLGMLTFWPGLIMAAIFGILMARTRLKDSQPTTQETKVPDAKN